MRGGGATEVYHIPQYRNGDMQAKPLHLVDECPHPAPFQGEGRAWVGHPSTDQWALPDGWGGEAGLLPVGLAYTTPWAAQGSHLGRSFYPRATGRPANSSSLTGPTLPPMMELVWMFGGTSGGQI